MVDSRDEIPPDYELLKTPDERPPMPPAGPNTGVWVAVAGLVVAASIAAYIVFGHRPPPAPVAKAPHSVDTSRQPPAPLGGQPSPIVVPPLDETDALVRQLAAQISSNPRVAAWLATDGLIRSFTVISTNVAEGKTPAVHLRMFRPPSSFAVTEGKAGAYVDPRSYRRYDGLAAAAASIDPAGAARLYATVKPRIEEAYQEIGAPDGTFDRTLERAIVLLLRTPIVDEPIRVQPRGPGYDFADSHLQALTAAQKQLLRAGPDNVRTIQASLRAIALALGIPAGRLPARTS